MFNTLLLSVAVALMGCSESDKYSYYEGNAAANATAGLPVRSTFPPPYPFPQSKAPF